MSMPPNQQQFQAGASHPWATNTAPQNPQNFQSPQPCYNCGSTAHIAQFCTEPRRQIPAGSINQPPRAHRIQKKNTKPIITRYPHPPQYPAVQPQAYPQQPQPQTYPQQPQPQPQAYPRQVPQAYPPSAVPSPSAIYPPQQPQWPQPYGYNVHQQWQQPQLQPHYGPHVAAAPAANYGPHQPPSYQGYNPNAHLPHAQVPQAHTPQPYYGFPRPGHPQAQPQAQFNPQFPRPHHQYRRGQPNKQRPQHHAPHSFPPHPPRRGSPAQGSQGPSQPSSQAATNNRRDPPPPKPPPCFPDNQDSAQVGRSNKTVYKPPERVTRPLAATFAETDAERREKSGEPEKDATESVRPSKYFDEKGARIDKYVTQPPADGAPEDPVFKSVRTGGSMIAEPLVFVLPDDPEENGDLELEKLLKELEDDTKMETYVPLHGAGSRNRRGSEGSQSGSSRPPSRGSGGSTKAESQEGVKDGTRKRAWHKSLEDASSGGSDDRRHGSRRSSGRGNKKIRSASPASLSQSSLPQPPHHPLPPKPKSGFRGGRGGRHRRAASPSRQYQVQRDGGGGSAHRYSENVRSVS